MSVFTILATAANAVLPIILIILLGYLLKRARFLTADFLKIGNWLVFHVCLPAMLFVNVYNIEGFAAIDWQIVLYSICAIVLLFGLGLVMTLATTREPLRRGVLWQCAFRSNYALIGLSLVSALGGGEAAAIAAILSAFTIPVFNIFGVIALSVFVGRKESWQKTAKTMVLGIVKNPLILSIALALLCLAVRETQVAVYGSVVFSLKEHTPFLYTAAQNLKSVASPFALLVLGGQFEFSAVKGMWKEITAGTVFRLVVAPLLGIGGAVLLVKSGVLQCGPDIYPGLIALFGSPVAVSSAIMAGSMGNDKQLATQLVVWTSLFSIITVFATVCIMMAFGLL